MPKLEADVLVLAALGKAFPKPRSAATKGLEKYLNVLGQQLDLAVLNGRTPEQLKFGLYSVSLHQIMHKGGQIGPQKVRLHKWLKDNDFELIKTVSKGSNLTGKLSEVVLTPLLTMREPTTFVPQGNIAGTIDTHNNIDGDDLIRRVYPELIDTFDEENFGKRYDTIDVDMKSLSNYVEWLRHDSNLLSKDKREHAIAQARFIMSVAQALDGKFVQRKIPSDFGRTYYDGTSIQNVNRTLRSAVLGNCWEYDIRSSVICWKMGYSKRLLQKKSIADSVDEAFKFTQYYINHKADMTKGLCNRVFAADSKVSKELQAKLIKEAFTAISFGARALEAGWKDDAGQWNNSALVKIIRNTDERKRFLGDFAVKRFVAEQNLLDRFIFEDAVANVPHLADIKALQTVSGKASKAKVLAYLYQHAETMVMDIVADVAAAHGHMPIARVHDAIFFRKSLGEILQDRVTWAMRDFTGNNFWSLKREEVKGFERPTKLERKIAQKHAEWIQFEERNAEKWFKENPYLLERFTDFGFSVHAEKRLQVDVDR